jgi:hypothetical protein
MTREELVRLREEFGLDLPDWRSETWGRLCDELAIDEDARAAEWMVLYDYGKTHPVFADKACVRRYRRRSCHDAVLGEDGRCRGQAVCPDWWVAPPASPKPVSVPEQAGFDFGDFDWEE